MRYEYDRPLLLLWSISARPLRLSRCTCTHVFLISLVNQTAQQALRMIYDVGSGLAERGRSVVAVGKDADILDFVRQEVFEPERVRLGMCPGLDGVAAQAVHGDYTSARSARSALRSTVAMLPRRHVQTVLSRCGVTLTRAYTRWSFPEVDARLKATLQDDTKARIDICGSGKDNSNRRWDGRKLRSGWK